MFRLLCAADTGKYDQHVEDFANYVEDSYRAYSELRGQAIELELESEMLRTISHHVPSAEGGMHNYLDSKIGQLRAESCTLRGKANYKGQLYLRLYGGTHET